MSRDGNDLVLTFEGDNGVIVIAGFYEVYSNEEMPSFTIGELTVKGEDFFTAQNAADIMPAAGPGQQRRTGNISGRKC